MYYKDLPPNHSLCNISQLHHLPNPTDDSRALKNVKFSYFALFIWAIRRTFLHNNVNTQVSDRKITITAVVMLLRAKGQERRMHGERQTILKSSGTQALCGQKKQIFRQFIAIFAKIIWNIIKIWHNDTFSYTYFCSFRYFCIPLHKYFWT